MFCGTDPFPEMFRAKKYKIGERYLSKKDFLEIMRNLPVPVTDVDIEEIVAIKVSKEEFEQRSVDPTRPSSNSTRVKRSSFVPNLFFTCDSADR